MKLWLWRWHIGHGKLGRKEQLLEIRSFLFPLLRGGATCIFVIVLSFSYLICGGDSAFADKQKVIVKTAQVTGDQKKTRFILEINQEIPFHVYSLVDPYRVVIDLPRVDFEMPRGTGAEGRGLVTAYRYGLMAQDKSRIVLDAKKPVLVKRSFLILPQQKGKSVKLIVDLEATDRSILEGQGEISKGVLPQIRLPKSEEDQIKRKGQERAPPLDAPLPPRSLPVIVIDPGHGGVDAGAIAVNGMREKDIVLSFSKKLQEALKETRKYEVILTRREDIFLPLAERVAIARASRADIFVSVHADKFRTRDVHGATVYTLSHHASDSDSAALADEENKADIAAGLDIIEEVNEVSDILVDLVRRETRNFSVHLAQFMVQSLGGSVTLNKNPQRAANFRVLMAPDIPSVLVELGYLSNDRDVRDLSSDQWQGKAVAATVRAIRSYFESRFTEESE